jgi:hypothetical protein
MRTCPACGEHHADESLRFCDQCGAALIDAPLGSARPATPLAAVESEARAAGDSADNPPQMDAPAFVDTQAPELPRHSPDAEGSSSPVSPLPSMLLAPPPTSVPENEVRPPLILLGSSLGEVDTYSGSPTVTNSQRSAPADPFGRPAAPSTAWLPDGPEPFVPFASRRALRTPR